MRRLIKLKDAARQLQVEVSTLRRWRLTRSHLEFVKVGGRVCVSQESIDQLVLSNVRSPLESIDQIENTLTTPMVERRLKSCPQND